MPSRKLTLTRTLSPPSKRHGRDRSRGPGFSSCDCRNFWPRAIGRAANLIILTPSTGAFSGESETLFGLQPVGKGVLWSAPVNPASEEVGASIRLDQPPLRRDQISVKLSSPSPFTSEA